MEASNTPFQPQVDQSFTPVPLQAGVGKQPLLNLRALHTIFKSEDRKAIKKSLRSNNWPADHEVRTHLWYRICCLVEKQDVSIYNEMVKSVFGDGKHSAKVSLPTFINPTTMYHYHLSDQGVHMAKRMVCVIGSTNPDITFAPAVFPMVCLFLHYMHEETAYNTIYSLLRSNNGYLVQTKLHHEASKFVLKELAKKYARGCFNYISKQGLAVEGVLENWLDWILNDLPFQILVRVLDCYLYEGPKVLYRVALAILILFHKQIGSKTGGTDVAVAIKQFCEDMPVPVDKLLKTAFGIRGLSRKELRKTLLKCEMYVKSMRHVSSLPHMTKSASCESLNLKVSRSFSGTITGGSKFIGQDEPDGHGATRGRSQSSHGVFSFTSVRSNLININDWQAIWSWLPARITLLQPHLLYTTAEHGTSLKMFYQCVDGHEPTLILLKDGKDHVAGAYCSTDWDMRRSLKKFGYFGSGESFLFKIKPQHQQYEWVGKKLKDATPNSAHFFMAGNDSKICIGGGGGEGLQLDGDLLQGRSERCDTYNNEPLFDTKDFQCMAVEVFGFR